MEKNENFFHNTLLQLEKHDEWEAHLFFFFQKDEHKGDCLTWTDCPQLGDHEGAIWISTPMFLFQVNCVS